MPSKVLRAAEVILPNPIDPLTFDEWHSGVLGLVGYWLGRGRRPLVAVALAVFALAGTHRGEDDAPGLRTISTEPWYFIGVLFVSYQAGRLANSSG